MKVGRELKICLCSGDTKVFIGISVDAVYKIPNSSFFAGIGGRAGTPSNPYITGGAFFGQDARYQIKGAVWPGSPPFGSISFVVLL